MKRDTDSAELARRIEAIWERHPEGARRLPPHQRAHSKGQAWMAERLGVAPNTLRGWIAGRRAPRRTVALLLERIEQEA